MSEMILSMRRMVKRPSKVVLRKGVDSHNQLFAICFVHFSICSRMRRFGSAVTRDVTHYKNLP